ncbi:unnamed protein product [Cochlearia groenlandica]
MLSNPSKSLTQKREKMRSQRVQAAKVSARTSSERSRNSCRITKQSALCLTLEHNNMNIARADTNRDLQAPISRQHILRNQNRVSFVDLSLLCF